MPHDTPIGRNHSSIYKKLDIASHDDMSVSIVMQLYGLNQQRPYEHPINYPHKVLKTPGSRA